MAEVKLKLQVEAGKDFFHVYDKTGKYDKKNNSLGWGKPNTLLTDVVSSKVRVYLPKSEDYIEVDASHGLPSDNPCVGIEVVPADLSLTEFPPGVYKFEYSLGLRNGRTLCQVCYIFFYQPLECCISKKRLKTNPNDATSDLAKQVIELQALLNNAKWCACSGKLDCAQEISDYIWTNCGCCC